MSRKNGKASRGKRMLWRDIKRTVGKSRGRFVSIVLLMALGAFALVGLNVAGPDMRITGRHYFDTYNAADLTIIGGLGIDESDEAVIERASGISDVEYGYMKDVTVADTHNAVRVSSLPERISQYEVVEGRLPEAADEVAISATIADEHPVGSTIVFTEEEDISGDYALARHDFTVVGVVNSSEIVSNLNMGQSQAGTGDLAGFAVVADDAFDVDYHMVARLRFDDTEGLDPYGQEYLDRVAAHKEELEELLEGRGAHRLAAVQGQFDEQIADGQAQVDDARAQLDDAAAELADASAQLADARELIASYEGELADAAAQLADGRAALDATWGQLEAAKAQLDAGRAELEASERQLAVAARQLADGRRELAEKQQQYDEGAAEVDAAQQQVDAARKKLEGGKAQYEQGIAQLEAAIEQAGAAGEDTTALEAQLTQLKAAYEAFMNVDADQGTAGDDGGYYACIQAIDAAQDELDGKRAELASLPSSLRKRTGSLPKSNSSTRLDTRSTSRASLRTTRTSAPTRAGSPHGRPGRKSLPPRRANMMSPPKRSARRERSLPRIRRPMRTGLPSTTRSFPRRSRRFPMPRRSLPTPARRATASIRPCIPSITAERSPVQRAIPSTRPYPRSSMPSLASSRTSSTSWPRS